jgi:hypothetical protein
MVQSNLQILVLFYDQAGVHLFAMNNGLSGWMLSQENEGNATHGLARIREGQPKFATLVLFYTGAQAYLFGKTNDRVTFMHGILREFRSMPIPHRADTKTGV